MEFREEEGRGFALREVKQSTKERALDSKGEREREKLKLAGEQ